MRAVIYLSFAFGISELALVLFRRARTGLVKTRGDRGSLIIMWIAMISCITAGFFLAKYSRWLAINYVFAAAGIMLYIFGLIIRWLSIIRLKQRFTVDVAVNREHHLETGGLYRYLRHPSYSGLLLIITGLSLAMNSLISLIVVVVPVFFSISYRIIVEERLLVREFGQSYINFCATRKRIIPFIY